jgi:hypothetical protein
MRKLAVSLIGTVGIALSFSVFANVDFDDHDEIAPGADIQNVVIPGDDIPTNSEEIEEYQRLLEEATQRGDLSQVGKFIAQQPSPIPDAIIPGIEELPFTLLDSSLDRDQDGLSDGDEIRLMTKPNNPDTDNDGYIDGLEVIRGYNPLVAGPNDKIEYKEPTGQAHAQYKITGIRLTGYGEDEKMTVTGMGPNNGLVAILLYSTENKLWITRTDKTGRFIYVSADTLDPGEYKAYASSVSANGLPLTFSKPLAFERTIDALIKKAEPSQVVEIPNDTKETKLDTITMLIVSAGVFIVMGAAVVLWKIRRKKKAQKPSSST